MLAIILATQLSSYAQNNTNEAKAAYMLAEESYAKGDYKTALDYLQQVKTALGSTNCKVLYLQIIVTKELNAKNPNVSELILPLITEFEQAPDYKDFNEDKTLEITKIKLEMKRQQQALKEKNDKERAAREAEDLVNKAFDKISYRYPPLDFTIDQLNAARPELNVKKWKANKTYSSVLVPSFMDYDFPKERYPFGRVDKGVDYKNQVVSLQYLSSGGTQKIFSYVGILVYTDKDVNPESAVAALAEADAIIERYTKELGKPVIAADEDKKDAHFTVYRWETKDRRLDVCKQYYPNGTQPVVKLFEEVRKK